MIPTDDSDPVGLLERKDLRDFVQNVLQSMPEHRRDLIVLRDLEELSYQQIAEMLNCSPTSIRLRLFRARRDFKARVTAVQMSDSEVEKVDAQAKCCRQVCPDVRLQHGEIRRPGCRLGGRP